MKKTYYLFRFVLLDLIAAFIAWLLFFSLRKWILNEEQVSLWDFEILTNAAIIATFWGIYYAVAGLYKEVFRRSRVRDLFKLISSNFPGVVLIFFLLLLDDEGVTYYKEYYKTFIVYYSVHTLFVFIGRVISITYVRRQIAKDRLFFNTLVVGSAEKAKEIYDEVSANKSTLGLRILGCTQITYESHNLFRDDLRTFGTFDRLPTIIRRCKVEQVIIAIEPSEHEKIREILNILQGCKVRIAIIPDIYQLLLGSVKVNQIFGIPLIEINQDLIPVWQKILKRVLDIFFSFLVLVLGFPILLMFAVITKATSSGPVFYLQERIGRGGIPFKIIKYRSMYIGAEKNGPALASSHDNRITPWGKFMRRFRFDELPQFYNVLRGDMSLVGPRPERQFFIDQIVKVAPEYLHLQKVRPGITSLGQVKFGYAENVAEMVKRLKYDIFYIENMSLAMDFRIILYTVLIILQGRGK